MAPPSPTDSPGPTTHVARKPLLPPPLDPSAHAADDDGQLPRDALIASHSAWWQWVCGSAVRSTGRGAPAPAPGQRGSSSQPQARAAPARPRPAGRAAARQEAASRIILTFFLSVTYITYRPAVRAEPCLELTPSAPLGPRTHLWSFRCCCLEMRMRASKGAGGEGKERKDFAGSATPPPLPPPPSPLPCARAALRRKKNKQSQPRASVPSRKHAARTRSGLVPCPAGPRVVKRGGRGREVVRAPVGWNRAETPRRGDWQNNEKKKM